MFWTVEKDRELRSLVDVKGKSFSEAAMILSNKYGTRVTRNAVKGRITRLRVGLSPERKPMSETTLNSAKAMKAGGLSWNYIAKELGVSAERLKNHLEPGFKERVNANKRTRRAAARAGQPRIERRHIVFSRSVANPLYDPKRDGVIDPPSLTAALLGDPFPGRAELMRRLG